MTRRITAVIPAHNESDCVAGTVAALLAQVTRVIVVCDNCTDDTYEVATAAGAYAMRTIGNSNRKAGALNQALNLLIPEAEPDDMFLVCDADTQICENWVERALEELDSDKRVGAVGAVFHADRSDGFWRLCQAAEWNRYTETIAVTGKTFVLSGTSALIRQQALRDVRDRTGTFYNEDSITEDFTFTLDLLASGWQLRSPLECSAKTETMPGPKMLFLQRRRWYLGALQEVHRRGFSKVSARYWGQQVMLGVSVFAMFSYLMLLTVLAFSGGITLSWFWATIGTVFAVERVYTIWPYGWRKRFVAALVIPELVYAIWLQVAYIGAILQFITGSRGTWSHVESDTTCSTPHPST